MEPSQLILVVAFGMAMLMVLLVMGMFLMLARPWFRAFMHGTPVMLMQILGMRLRGNPPSLLVDAYITLRRAGDEVSIADVENAYIDNRARILGSQDLVEQVRKRREADDSARS